MRPILLLEQIKISSPDIADIYLMEGISSTIEKSPTSGVDFILNNIDDHAYVMLMDYLKMLFNEAALSGKEQAMRFLDQAAMGLWKLYKSTLDSLNSIIDQMPESAIIEDANLKKTIKSMFSIGLDDHDIIEAVINGNAESMKTIVSTMGIDNTASYIEQTIRSEKANALLHRIKDTLLPMVRNDLTAA